MEVDYTEGLGSGEGGVVEVEGVSGMGVASAWEAAVLSSAWAMEASIKAGVVGEAGEVGIGGTATRESREGWLTV